jgi:hypothetical protein
MSHLFNLDNSQLLIWHVWSLPMNSICILSVSRSWNSRVSLSISLLQSIYSIQTLLYTSYRLLKGTWLWKRVFIYIHAYTHQVFVRWRRDVSAKQTLKKGKQASTKEWTSKTDFHVNFSMGTPISAVYSEVYWALFGTPFSLGNSSSSSSCFVAFLFSRQSTVSNELR